MKYQNLKSALLALQKADVISKAKQVHRAPFREFIANTSCYQNMSEEERKAMSDDVEVWYSDEAVQQRGADYMDKVFSDKEQKSFDVDDARAKAREVSQGFAKVFGLSQFSHLPPFQQQLLTMMCAIHLRVMPKNMSGFNMDKGIFVAGKPQIGKTSVFIYLKSTNYFRYRVITGNQLFELCKSHGMAVINEYGTRGACLLIDEIGWEDAAQNYGSAKIDAVAEILHRRHARGLMTHITSNMSIDDLSERYQPHIVARIKSMCNIIEVKGQESFV